MKEDEGADVKGEDKNESHSEKSGDSDDATKKPTESPDQEVLPEAVIESQEGHTEQPADDASDSS